MELLLVALLLGLPFVPFFILNGKKRKRLAKLRMESDDPTESEAFSAWKAERTKALTWAKWGWIGAMLWAIFPLAIILVLVAFSYAGSHNKKAKRLEKALPPGLA